MRVHKFLPYSLTNHHFEISWFDDIGHVCGQLHSEIFKLHAILLK